ncbi:OprD family outer membrane porin [Pseudomonas sp. NPDC007930]|uniref:OprD family outer membrane porin n=1 Tax=Pseudomonas sp. NPDC007930 TaxID=3364417 RepID=UPI0036E2E15E
MRRHAATVLLLVASAGQALADSPASLGQVALLSRSYWLGTDGQQGAADRREGAQGFLFNAESAFTPGTLGVGLDVHAFAGFKLDGGRGHAGTGLLPQDSDGRSAAGYSSAGAALKLKLGATQLQVGEMTVQTPVFDTADKRLRPEYASGALLSSQPASGLQLQAGRFTAFSNQASSNSDDDFAGYGASTRHGGISLAGLSWAGPGTPYSAALYAGQLDDTWRQLYANLGGSWGRWGLDGNAYRTRSTGAEQAGAIDTLAWSLAGSATLGSHRFTLAYQKVQGNTPFDFVGGDSIYLANSVKYADFNGPGEHSWQARYQWNGRALGLPGLAASLRYVRGAGIDGSHAPAGGAYAGAQGADGRHWERDFDLGYTVQGGTFKGLALSLAQVSHRANAAQGGSALDRLYLIIEYPWGASL